jgi:hypothetical protein
MYRINPHSASTEFVALCAAARAHLENQVDGGIRFWLRLWPQASAIEHLCFRLGNQVFVVRVLDVHGQIDGPGDLASLRATARGLHAHPCLLPMRRSSLTGEWVADSPSWGLVCARSGRPVHPVELVTEDEVVVSDWEVHHFATQATLHALAQSGLAISSWHADPRVFPTIWFSRPDGEQGWIVVRAARYPLTPKKPRQWRAIVKACTPEGTQGHYLPVLVSADNNEVQMTPTSGPLLRGHPLQAFFLGPGAAPWATP